MGNPRVTISVFNQLPGQLSLAILPRIGAMSRPISDTLRVNSYAMRCTIPWSPSVSCQPVSVCLNV